MIKKTNTTTIALAILVLSLLLGVSYFSYISTVSFPSESSRIIPLLWLLLAIISIISAVKAMLRNRGDTLAIVGALLGVPNIMIALVFALGALLGD